MLPNSYFIIGFIRYGVQVYIISFWNHVIAGNAYELGIYDSPSVTATIVQFVCECKGVSVSAVEFWCPLTSPTMESFHRLVKAQMKAQQKAAFDSEKNESETSTVGIANATAAMEKQLGGSLDVPLPAQKSLKTMGDEMQVDLEDAEKKEAE